MQLAITMTICRLKKCPSEFRRANPTSKRRKQPWIRHRELTCLLSLDELAVQDASNWDVCISHATWQACHMHWSLVPSAQMFFVQCSSCDIQGMVQVSVAVAQTNLITHMCSRQVARVTVVKVMFVFCSGGCTPLETYGSLQFKFLCFCQGCKLYSLCRPQSL